MVTPGTDILKRLLPICLLLSLSSAGHATPDLPSLGDSTSGLISLQQEKELGSEWLRSLRSQAPTIEDPMILTWFQDLVYELVPNAGLQDPQLALVVVDSPELNAFAVPGGIVGINLGLLLYSDDEDEVASVLAHELAHLSQRHFARQVEAAQRRDPVTLATLLASIVLIATNNTDAGVAGLMGSQAAAIQNQLAYSRDFEREADRLGMTTLSRSGRDPHAMTDMFSNMLAAGRYRGASLEFLMTHPLTSSRVADAEGRAAQLPAQARNHSFMFSSLHLLTEARYQLKDNAEAEFNRRLTDASGELRDALLYNLARIAGNQSEWNKGLDYLARTDSNEPEIQALKARLLSGAGRYSEALALLQETRRTQPDNLSLRMTEAAVRIDSGDATTAVTMLKKITETAPGVPSYWTLLSRAADQSGDTILAYRALGESYYYSGRRQEAAQQMQSALREAGKAGDFQREAAIRERLKAIDPPRSGNGRP